jgi:CHAT domain-containing protein
MTRGFMYAGSSRVIAGLWDADDLVTTELVRNFHEAMEQDKMAPAAALRYAKIQV